MLATTPWPSPYSHAVAYAPARPSPLSPRSANARRFPHQDADMPKPNQHSPPQTSPSRLRFRDVPFSKRPIKPTPFTAPRGGPATTTAAGAGREAARDARRRLFLRQVAERRDEARFTERGEQLQRLDFRADRRRWEAEKARSATPYLEEQPPADLDDLVATGSQGDTTFVPMESSQTSRPGFGDEERGRDDYSSEEMDAELLRRQEEAEMEALLALMDEQESQRSSRYGSDDEYDGIFDDLVMDGGGGQEDFIMVEKEEDVEMIG